MKLLVFTGRYLPGYKGGGPIKTIKNLCNAVSSPSFEFSIVTSDRDLGDVRPYSEVKIGNWNSIGNAKVFYTSFGYLGLKQIKSIIAHTEHDLIYINSFFSVRYSLYPQFLAWVYGKTVVLAPRGEFSPGALELKPIRKKLFISLYKLLGFHRRTIFQGSTAYEESEIKSTLGKFTDTVVAENIGSTEVATQLPLKVEKLVRIVFVSRISPKKNLLQALKILKSVSVPVEYDIYGPIEDDAYWSQCQKEICSLPSHINVNYKGGIESEYVVKTISNYDLFFMPTKGENFGHVIAEAICAGLPILISDKTPWRQLEDKGIGWDISLQKPQKFVKVIEEMFEMDSIAYMSRRESILIWARAKFFTSDAIQENIQMFNYALENSEKSNVI